MKKYFTLSIAFFLAGTFIVSAAADSVDILLNKDTSVISTGGRYDDFLKNEYVTYQVLYPGKSVSDMTGNSGDADIFKQFAQTTVSDKGEFSFAPVRIEDAGEYTVVVTREKDGEQTVVKLFVPNHDDVTAFLKKVNTKGQISSAVNDDIKNNVVGLDYKFYSPLSTKGKTLTAQRLEEDGEFSDLSDFEESFLRQSIMQYLAEADSSKTIADTLILGGEFASYNYSEQLKKIMDYDTLMNGSAGKAIKTMTEQERNTAGGYINDIDFSDEEGFRDAIAVGVIKTKVAKCGGWNEITNVIEEFYDILSLKAASKYSSVADKKDLNLKIAEGKYTTVEELLKLITDHEVSDNNNSTQNSGRSSGGGSGGNSGASAYANVDINNLIKGNDTDNKNNRDEDVFKDLDAHEWAKEAIYTLYGRGIINGRGERIYAPAENIKREEFAKLIVSAAETDQPGEGISFEDVPEDAWYYSFVNKGFSSGLIKGISDTLFGSGRNITRQDMMVMIYRAAKMKGIAFPEECIAAMEYFADHDEISDYAIEAVDRLYDAKIIAGSDSLVRPKDYLTRAEAAQVIYNFMLRANMIK